MRKSSIWPLSDWIALVVRWAFIASVSLWFAYHDELDSKILILIFGMMITNSAGTVLTASYQTMTGLRVLYLLSDFAFASLGFLPGGQPGEPGLVRSASNGNSRPLFPMGRSYPGSWHQFIHSSFNRL